MVILLTVVLFILAIALIALVLIQPDRSHGTAGVMGGGASTTIFGVTENGGPLVKATEIVAASFVVVSLLIHIFQR